MLLIADLWADFFAAPDEATQRTIDEMSSRWEELQERSKEVMKPVPQGLAGRLEAGATQAACKGYKLGFGCSGWRRVT